MTGIKKSRKLYNPNSFNALDAAIAFIAALLVLFAEDKLFQQVIQFLRDGENAIDYYLIECVYTLVSQSSMILIVLLFCKIRRVSVFSGGGYVYRFDAVKILFAVLLMLGAAILLTEAHYKLTSDLFEILYGYSFEKYEEAYEKTVDGSLGYLLILEFLLVPLLPCICEEALFRGVVMRGLREYGLFASALLSSLCFCFMHGSVMQLLLQFVGGLLIAAVVILTKNFLIGSAMHFANNLFISIFAVMGNVYGFENETGGYLYDAILILLGVVFVVVGAYYYINLAVAEAKRKATGGKKELTLGEAEVYSVIRKENEPPQILYPVQIDHASICDGSFLYTDSRGVERRVNGRSNSVVSAILLGAGLVFSLIIIFDLI